MEDDWHMLLYCSCMVKDRRQMEGLMEETVKGWHEIENKENMVSADGQGM